MEGVTNIRGKIVPIISLRKRFQLGETSVIHKARIVVVNHNEEMIGIVVDGVNQVIKFSDIQPLPKLFLELMAVIFKGLASRKKDLSAF